MTRTRDLLLLLAFACLASACGGGTNTRKCDENTVYLEARAYPKVVAPDDLSQLDPDQEMVLPEASPRSARPAGSPCLDIPPSLPGSTSEEKK